ncbi:hypothetical protein GGD83_003827 [Rhodoblastus sphagnicola]|nr:hypothetical protein [Rhodoblastus sphagnicola]MBB4200000.1 hypothetical protein [Rhodoblastus sphagnicola]
MPTTIRRTTQAGGLIDLIDEIEALLVAGRALPRQRHSSKGAASAASPSS